MDVAGPRSLRRLLDAILTIGGDLDLPSMLDRIVRAAVDLVDARYGALGVLDETRSRLAQFITVGLTDEQRARIGALPDGHGILGLLIVDAKPLRLPDLAEHPDSSGFPPNHPPMHSFLGVPIRVRDQVFGNLYLTDKTSAEVFSDVDEELVVGLASAAAVAIENARLHARLSELVLVGDRERIARDLHDSVIQRLFAAGLGLQATARLVQDEAVAARLDATVDELDQTVKQIRTAIFGLERRSPTQEGGLRSQVIALVSDAGRGLGFDPRVLFDGAIDTLVQAHVAEELLASLREALTNVAKHARASAAEIELAVGHDVLLRVSDDGVGPPSERHGGGHGLHNLSRRAEKLGGSCSLTAGPQGGAILEWRVPRAT